MNSYFRLVLLSVLVVAFTGCANGIVGAGPKGELSTKLVIAPGVDESEINYVVTGNSIDPITGTITIVSNPVELLISGVPVGVGYSITLSTADAQCTGTAQFDVIESQTTTVTVPIQCSSTPPKRGGADITGQFILCPTITSMVVSPTTVDLGGTIHVSTTAKNLGTGALTYTWTATGGGSFADATAANTTYQCSVSGNKTLTITVSTAGCTDDSLSVDVTCGGGVGPVCGNGILETGEKCDNGITAGQPGACPTACPKPSDPCKTSTLTGTAADCTAQCVDATITVAVCGDGCVTAPETCEPPNTVTCDANCKTIGNLCGNGVVDSGETCDTAISAGQPGACPTSCTAPNACTTSVLQGNACTAKCVNTPIVPCCGNGVLETGETCDTAIAAGQPGACPTTCTPPDSCTTSVLQNNHTCTATCANTQISACVNGDGCCPKGCNATNDNDCLAVCGNGVIETGEQCDPPVAGSCSSTCQSCIDLTGTWIASVTTGGSIAAPDLLGDPLTDAAIDFVLRVVVTKSGSALNTQFDICSLSTSTPSTSAAQIDITYQPAVLATLTASGSTTTNVCPTVGGTVTFPTFTINSGWGGPPAPASNTCPVPASGTTSCSGAIDSDGDGIYGDTLPISYNGGLLNFDLYAGLTLTAALNGMTLTNASTQSGAMNLAVVGYLYGSSLTAVSSDLSITTTPNPVSMTAIKLTGNVPCATVLQHCSGATCVP